MRDRRAARAEAGGEGRVGRYLVQGEIATGGMATVHVGRLIGPAGFSRDVAIKRLHPQFAKNPDFVNMFLDEARLASRVLHPNVVPILDVVAEAGELFLVMEFVTGESLSKLVRASPEGMPLSLASAIAVGMLEGLHAAHEARGERGEPLGIVHRDVSPQNVLVGADGVARLIDFGVAKASGNATMTRDGEIKGKVAYMAPEQITATKLDRRADIYSASVVLWEMLTGRRYFGEVESDAALMIRAMSAVATAPSSVRPEIPAELDALVLRGLAREREARFASAREMAQALEKVAAPAAARDVARWVEAKAGASVRGRAQQLSHFDVSVATALPGKPSIPMDGAPDAAREPISIVTASVVAPAALPAAAPVAAAVPPSAPAPAPATRRGVYTAAALALALGVGFAAARLLDGRPTEVASGARSISPPAPSAARAAPGDVSAPREAPTSAATGVPAIAPASAAPAAEASAAPSTLVSSAGRRAPPAGKATAAAAAKPNCNPSYVITADGVRQYKPECLK